MSVEIVHLRVEDVPKCQRLSDEAGWNQNENDWSFIIGQGSAYGIWRRDDLIATAAIVPYGSAFGWICMVLVAARERRQGLASRLLRHCIDELVARNMVAGLRCDPGRPRSLSAAWLRRHLSADPVRVRRHRAPEWWARGGISAAVEGLFAVR